jgi:YggT family protein
MYPFMMLLSSIINLLNIGLFVYVILGVLISFNIVNSYQPIVSKVMIALKRIYEPMLKPIQRILPDLGGIDISPIILFLLLNFLETALVYYLMPHRVV